MMACTAVWKMLTGTLHESAALCRCCPSIYKRIMHTPSQDEGEPTKVKANLQHDTASTTALMLAIVSFLVYYLVHCPRRPGDNELRPAGSCKRETAHLQRAGQQSPLAISDGQLAISDDPFAISNFLRAISDGQLAMGDGLLAFSDDPRANQ